MRTALSLCLLAWGASGSKPSEGAAHQGPTPPNAHDYPYERNTMIELMAQSDYQGASAFLAQHLDQCKASKDCVYDAEVLFANWSLTFENVGDWQGARKTLRSCLEALPGDAS